MRYFSTTKRKKLGIIDLIVFLFVGVVGYYFYNNIQDTLVYQWRWEDLWSYFFSWHPEKKIWFFNTLSLGLISTLKIILWSFFLALLLGFFTGYYEKKILKIAWGSITSFNALNLVKPKLKDASS